MSSDKPIKIDLQKVLEERLGTHSRYVPSFVVRALEKLICQDEMNSLLENNFPLQGPTSAVACCANSTCASTFTAAKICRHRSGALL